MQQLVTKPFPYFVGIHSLEELVTKTSRVCVINILGNESRKVTNISHEYSGGNVVAGVQYGRRAVLETKIGDIPVYRSIRDVMKHDHCFDIGVIYLPPMAVSQAVWELVRYNNELKRIVIITEKVPTRDSRNIRYICQDAGVDVIGCNCLGIANAWDHVRVGGALGGDRPEEVLIQGSIALHSNSGNFTTTIAQYMQTRGFGISTAVSSGKDVYIHFAVPEFLYAAQNDPRTKAVVLYVEPGGYYEKMALEWIKARRFGFNKPIVVCVTGRWKKQISRPCGHAGAMAGSGDDAESKEQWFDNYFEKSLFNPEKPDVSKKGIRVSSIQNIPDALAAVFKKIDEPLDFEPRGDLALKPWIKDKLISLPASLSVPVVQAIPPYDEQIRENSKQIGANYLRQNMRNKSGASKINPKTQVAELHGKSVIELTSTTLEENLYFALAKIMPEKRDIRRMNILLNAFMKLDNDLLNSADRLRQNQATPNTIIASHICQAVHHPMLRKITDHARFIIDLIREYEVYEYLDAYNPQMDKLILKKLLIKGSLEIDPLSEFLIKEIRHTSRTRPSLYLCAHILDMAQTRAMTIRDAFEFLIASLVVCILWNPMLEKRIPRQVVEEAASHIYLLSRIMVAAMINRQKNTFWKKFKETPQLHLVASFSENGFKMLFNRTPSEIDLLEMDYLLGLTITNGPGTLSAKGAKESVSAKNDIPMSYVGFLSNTGLAHGGNGFEAVDFLLKRFRAIDLKSVDNIDPTIDLVSLANQTAKEYDIYKFEAKEKGDLNYDRIPCINHPVFKGNDINIDPREDFIRSELKKHNIGNIFLDYYHALVKELFNEGVTRNVFCVNVDAVLACISLKLFWEDLQSGKLKESQLQELVFSMFIIGRTIGTAAEINDHRIRGTDMDCRTPQSEVSFVM